MSVIEAPTPWVWVIGRTQTNGPEDYAAVREVQDAYAITPLQETQHVADPSKASPTEPLRLVNGMSAVEFFGQACEAMRVNPPHSTDFSVLARIANLGIVPGEAFDPCAQSADALAEIEAGATAAREAIAANIAGFGTHANGWMTATETIGVYGNAYLKRATVALAGLGANPPEDAVYPVLLSDADGEPTTGDRDYVIHLDAGELPPVDAF